MALTPGRLVTGPTTRNDPPPLDDWGMVVRIVGGIIVVGPIVVDPQTFGTAIVTSVPVTAVSTTLLAANVLRKAAAFHNGSANRFLFLKWGAGASLASYSVRIGPQSYYELPAALYNGIVTGIWNAAGAGACLVTELTPP
jgi:hypothetical protein